MDIDLNNEKKSGPYNISLVNIPDGYTLSDLIMEVSESIRKSAGTVTPEPIGIQRQYDKLFGNFVRQTEIIEYYRKMPAFQRLLFLLFPRSIQK